MADIALGGTITGSFAANSPKDLTGKYYAEYNLTGLDSFRQLTINGGPKSGSNTMTIDLINSATGAIINEKSNEFDAPTSAMLDTTYPGINYKIRISSTTSEDYVLSTVDGGKATAILSFSGYGSSVGTVGTDGKLFPLASGKLLLDLALAPNGKFYGISNNLNGTGSQLTVIDPSLDLNNQVFVPAANIIKDLQGNVVASFSSLEVTPDNKLYGISNDPTGDKLYTIDPTTYIATLIGSGSLPNDFRDYGDLVYDAANSRFFATSASTDGSSDALWSIPLTDPTKATEIGQLGLFAVSGLDFEGGQLIGYQANNRVSINPTTGKADIVQRISGLFGGESITGATTLFPATSNPTPVPKPNPTPISGISITANNFLVTDSTFRGLGIKPVSQKSTSKINEIGAFAVDDVTGKINGIEPGAAGYLQAAASRAKPIFSALNRSFFSTSPREVALEPSKIYEFFEVQDGSIADLQQQIAAGKTPTNVLFAQPDANGNSLFKIATNATNDGYKVSVNNDELVLNVVKLTGTTPNVPVGAKSQGLAQGRVIDLSDAAYAGKTLKADITTKSDAAYTNTIGFYAVEDVILGTIRTAAGTTLNPSDANYATEAIKIAVSSLSATKVDSKTGVDILGGKIYAPVVIAKGTFGSIGQNFDNSSTDPNAIHAYFNYLGANPDKLDHFRLLGNNTFGVEDLYGGGDRDFNDVVVNVSIKV
jgi:Domain of unknown function (DUF4114)